MSDAINHFGNTYPTLMALLVTGVVVVVIGAAIVLAYRNDRQFYAALGASDPSDAEPSLHPLSYPVAPGLAELRERARATKARGAWGVDGSDMSPADWEYGRAVGPDTILALLDAVEALAYLAREEYPSGMSLAEAYGTWGDYGPPKDARVQALARFFPEVEADDA